MFDERMRKLAATVSTHGLHKLAARVMEQDGVTPPSEWTDEAIGRSLGVKVAKDLLARRAIVEGLVSLAKVSE